MPKLRLPFSQMQGRATALGFSKVRPRCPPDTSTPRPHLELDINCWINFLALWIRAPIPGVSFEHTRHPIPTIHRAASCRVFRAAGSGGKQRKFYCKSVWNKSLAVTCFVSLHEIASSSLFVFQTSKCLPPSPLQSLRPRPTLESTPTQRTTCG